MEAKGFTSSNHRRSSSDRLLALLSGSDGASTGDSSLSGLDFNEDDVLWKTDLTVPNRRPNLPSAATKRNNHFRKPESHGILDVLSDSDRNRTVGAHSVLSRRTSFTSWTRAIPAVPKSPQIYQESERSQSAPARNFHQSAPMNVPVLSKAMAKSKAKNSSLAPVEDDDDEGEEEMMPPHEIVVRGSGTSPKTTFSVLEGVGRTLKGRDLRQVRNAVWRKTGFLD